MFVVEKNSIKHICVGLWMDISSGEKNVLYAESLLFQSPQPSELPLPIFDKGGRIIRFVWPSEADKAKIRSNPSTNEKNRSV